MADSNLTVTVTANTGAAATEISNVEARLVALEKAFTAGTASAATHTQAEGAVASSMVKTGEAATGAGAALEILDKHVRVVSMGMEAAGMEASSAAVRISALAEVVKTAEGAFGPLLVVMLAFEAAMKSADFFKTATEQASAFQAQMETLGASVATQGGDWEQARAGVEAWLAQEAMASGILQSELLPALNDLVTAGHDLHDSQTMLAVAEEVAIAKHIDVRDVVRDLISAELGRARGLELLDANTKKVVDSHGKMSDLLKVLHKDFEKALDDDQSLERAHGRLKAEQEAVAMSIGNKLMPAMTDLQYQFLGAIKNAEILGDAIGTVFQGIAVSVGGAVTAMKALPDALAAGYDAIKHGNFKGAAGAMAAAAAHDISSGGAQIRSGLIIQGVGEQEAWAEIAHGVDAGAQGRHMAGAAVTAHKKRLDAKHGLDLNVDDPIGKPKTAKSAGGGGAPGSMSFTPIDPEASTKTDEYAVAQQKLADALKRTDDAEAGLAEKIKTATTVEGAASAQAAYDAQVTIDLLSKKSLLTDALRTEKSERDALTQKQRDAAAEAENARQAYNEYGKEMLAAGTNTIREQNILAELKAHYDEAKKAADGFASSIKTLDGNIRTNTTSLADIVAKLEAFKSKSEEAFGAASRSWETFQKKQAEALKEDLDTANLTNAQKVAYYGRMIAQMTALDAAYRARYAAADAEMRAAIDSGDQQRIRAATTSLSTIEQLFVNNEKSMEAADGKYTSSYKAAITDRENAYKAFITSVQGYETTFLDGVLKKHQSLRDSVKDVLSQMMSDWVNHLEAMLLKSSLLKGLTDPNGAFGKLLQSSGVLATPGGSTGNPQLDAAIAARITGEHALVQSGTLLTSSQTQVTGAANILSPALTDVATAAREAARALSSVQSGGGSGGGSILDQLPSLLGGSSSDGGGADGKAGFDPFALLTGGGSDFLGGSKDINVDSIGGKAVGPSGAMPTSLEKIGGAAMQGLMIGQMVAGMTGGNSTWGSVGGALGGAFFGPAGAAVGGAIGGLFGPHYGPPSNYPDRSDPTYNSWLAAFNSGPGGGGDALEKKLAAIDPKTLTGQDLKDYNYLKGLENGTGQLGITNEHNGVFSFIGGTTAAVTDFRAAVDRFSASTTAIAAATSSVYTLTRTYPDLNISSLQANGTYTPTPITQTGGGGGTTTGGSGSGSGGGTGGGTGGGGPNVNTPQDTTAGDLAVTVVMPNGDVLARAAYPGIMSMAGRQRTGLIAGRTRSTAAY